MSGEIYIQKRAHHETIEEFCGVLTSLLSVSKMERRESSNYAGEQYFRCDVLGVRLQLEEADDTDYSEYDYCVHMHALRGRGLFSEAMEGLADVIATEIAVAGYPVIRVTRTVDGNERNRICRKFVAQPDGTVVGIIIGSDGERHAS